MVVQFMLHISPNRFSNDFAFELRPLKYFVALFCLWLYRHTTLYTAMAVHQSKTYLECDRNNWFTVMHTFKIPATRSSPVTSMCVNICSASHADGRIEKVNAQWQMPNIAQKKRSHSNSFNWGNTIPKTHYTKVWKIARHIQINIEIKNSRN